VWSFWSKPYRARQGSVWRSDYHARLAWGLSVELARRHYPDTALVTDDAGARLLVDQLRLPFTRVALELNELCDHDPDWWALGKLYAYRLQLEPFVHLDSDVFLWKRLPPTLEASPVFAQSPERFDPDRDESRYPLRPVERTFAAHAPGRLPGAWRWYSGQPGRRVAANCGILGGQRTDVIRAYANLGIDTVNENRAAWSLWGDKGFCNVLVEQFLLNAVVEHRRATSPEPSDRDLFVNYLFPTDEAPYDPQRAEAAGYTHLIGGAKRNPELMADLEARMWADYPALAERCRALVS
jgi:hypothetical protein